MTVLSLLFSLNQLNLSSYFPIKTVRVYGVNRIDREEIKNLLLPLVSRGFFTVDVAHIKDQLSQIPWVADIFVKRYWPDQVEVTIIEKNAVARWNDTSLLSATGEIFSPQAMSSSDKLPKMIGPLGKQIMMLKVLNDINRLLVPIQVNIAILELGPYSTWKAVLDNGIVLQIGHKEILTRLYHFVKVYPKMIGMHAKDVEYVDLRYPNGVAVQWKKTMKLSSIKLSSK